MPSTAKPIIAPLLLIGILAISSAAVLIRLCDDAQPVTIAAGRMSVAFVLLLPIAAARRRPRNRLSPRTRSILVLGGALLAVHFFLWISSLRHTSVLSSVVLVTTNPIFVGIGSYLFFKERAGAALVVGILLAAAGGALITIVGGGDMRGSALGNALSVGGAIAASGYLLVGRKTRANVDLVTYLLWIYGIAAALLLLGAVALGAPLRGLRPQTYFIFFALGLVPQLIGHGILNYALKHVSATMVALCILGEPIGASVLAYLFLQERVGPWQLVGGAIILCGIYVAARRSPRRVPLDTRAHLA